MSFLTLKLSFKEFFDMISRKEPLLNSYPNLKSELKKSCFEILPPPHRHPLTFDPPTFDPPRHKFLLKFGNSPNWNQTWNRIVWNIYEHEHQ